ncbi:MAG: pitrilysin family protein [Candidatus Latescibacterota bacterium]|nr:pitrilysin family protein [Candidatus Latescibacterota bacterium]MEC8992367.1 pitrilysin family protein [Candidatus Latescibacterota bacterium]MEE3338600.1 pitrilysin family protein [Candidatus Latescibacterota bacterium]
MSTEVGHGQQPHSSERTHAMLGERICHHRWQNGVQLWACPRPGRSVSMHLCVAAGALHRQIPGIELPAGTAHFLEHRLFEKQDGDLSAQFAALGADIDAETGYTHTSFTCAVQPDAVDPSLRLMARLVQESYFPTEAVEREREIIQREIELYEDHLEWVAFHAATRALYANQPIAEDIAGTTQTLCSIDAEMLNQAHTHLYGPDRIQLIIVGPVDNKQALDLVGELFGSTASCLNTNLTRPEPAKVVPRRIETSLAVSRPRLWLGLGAASPWDKPHKAMQRELHLEWVLDILLGGASPFFSQHYESALIDAESFGSEIYVDEPFSFCLIGGDTDDPQRLGETLLATLIDSQTPDQIRADVDRARRRAYGELVSSFEDDDSVREFIETAALRSCHPFDLVDLYLETDAEDLIATWDLTIRDREAAWAVVGPHVENRSGD